MKSLLQIFLCTLFIFPVLHLNAQNALNFDGVNDFVQTSFAGVQGSNNRTFEAWVNVAPGAAASNLCISDYGLNAVGSRNTFSVGGDRSLKFISGGTNANISTAANVIVEGEWTHVAFVLDNGTGYLYKNGQQVGTGLLTTVNTPSGNQNLIIGQRVNGGSIPFEGSIDELRIWNVARTPQEIQSDTLMELCSSTPNLMAYYQFNQGMAGGNNSGINTLIDENGLNNGTLTGFTLNGSISNWISGKTMNPAPVVFANDTVTACDSYTSPSGNNTWTSWGNYVDTIPNAFGCDTALRINLTILNQSSSSITEIICDSLVSPSGNYVYTATGTYMDTIPNNAGCDSVITLNVVLQTINDSVSVNGNTLTALQNGANYQWFLCQAGLNPISGANSQSYTISSTGNYAVSLEVNGCRDTSDCVLAIFTGLNGSDLNKLQVFPNPNKGEIQFKGDFEGHLNIVDSKGISVYETDISKSSMNSINIPKSIGNGMYILHFQSDELILTRKLFLFRGE
ncbi:T9SS type A sorting domain-containing protein [Hyphobacterium sp. CCMP332]|nr:T9SS type A sorting domain-containing protein [Hyphobacterium sp. CCMP332]